MHARRDIRREGGRWGRGLAPRQRGPLGGRPLHGLVGRSSADGRSSAAIFAGVHSDIAFGSVPVIQLNN